MCGIAGTFLFDGQRPSGTLLAAMAERLRHRGPDGHDTCVNGPIGFAHTRLAILDPNGGAQPLTHEETGATICYNGEIYNSPALRDELIAKGYRFRTSSDTEVILTSYLDDPEGFVARLDGVFAFAIWDPRHRIMVLARDYMGVKPLYVWRNAHKLVFGSEIKALLADSDVPCQPDMKAFAEILRFQNVHGQRTCFANIESVAPGEILHIKENGSLTRRAYWSFHPGSQLNGDRSDGAQQLRATVRKVVTAQLLSDVPIASYLSGGMDTGSITAIARPHLGRLHTFSGGFDLQQVSKAEEGVDERMAAEMMSRHFDTQHHFTEINSNDLLDNFASIGWHLEEPRGSTCYAPYVMAREAGSQVKVILSGHGGDELFAGYQGRYAYAVDPARDWESSWYTLINHLIPDAVAPDLLAGDLASRELLAWPREVFQAHVASTVDMSRLKRSQHHDLFTYMQGLLAIEDKLSMAHGLESRVPLLGREVFDLAWQMPDDWKLGKSQGKLVFRDAMKGIVPDDIRARGKMGFGPPDNSYYRTVLYPFFEEMILGGFAHRGIVTEDACRDAMKEHLAGAPKANVLWTFASIELWMRHFVDGEAKLRTVDDFGPLVIAETGLETETQQKQPSNLDEDARTIRPTDENNSSIASQSDTLRFSRAIMRGTRGAMRETKKLIVRARAVCTSISKHFLEAFSLCMRGWKARTKAVWRELGFRIQKIFVPAAFVTYIRTAWHLRTGAYALTVREKFAPKMRKMTVTEVDPHKLRIFHGLYSTVQPRFLVDALNQNGHNAVYETLDMNPGYAGSDHYHATVYHPDLYYEHVHWAGNDLQMRALPVTDTFNLNTLEAFFERQWPLHDVYHFNWFLSFLPDGSDVELLRGSGKQVYFHFRGCFILTKIISEFAARGESVADACAHCKARGWRDQYFDRFYRAENHGTRVFVSTPNLLYCNSDFEYFPLSLEPDFEQLEYRAGWDPASRDEVIVMHAPSSAAMEDVKGTKFVKQAVEDLRNEGFKIDLRMIQNMTRKEAIAMFATADIFVEQLCLGAYGNTAIEAMASGVPVISSLNAGVAHEIPGCPVVPADPVTIKDRLRELIDNKERRDELGRAGYDFVRSFHSNKRITAHLTEIYKKDLAAAALVKRPVTYSLGDIETADEIEVSA